jgi:hypothetical protein
MTLKKGFCVAPKILGTENLKQLTMEAGVRSRRKTRRKRIPTPRVGQIQGSKDG